MKNILKIFLKVILRLFYIVDICIMILSAGFVIKWIIAEIKHDGLALIGLVGMVHGHAILMLIVSALIFIVLTVKFIKNRKRRVDYEQELQKVSDNKRPCKNV